MKRKAITLVIILLLLASAAEARRAPITGHLMAEPGDNWYMLCAYGHWETEINGTDSIRPVCVLNEVRR